MTTIYTTIVTKMAKHKNQPDLETDEAPSVDEFPYLPSLQMDGHVHYTREEPVRTGSIWSLEAVRTSENWSAGGDVTPVTTTTSSNGTTASVSSRRCLTDSGYGTNAEDSNSTSARLSSLIESLSLSSETEEQLHLCRSDPQFSSHTRSSEQGLHNRGRECSSSKKELDYSRVMDNMAAIKANPDMCLHQDEDGDTILHLAVLHSHIVCILMILQALVSPAILHLKNSMSQTPLHLAVLRRKPRIVRLLMTHGAPVEARDRNGNTPLHLACREGDLDSVKQLTLPLTSEETARCQYSFQPSTSLPQDPDVRNYHGDGCLHLAAAGGHLDIVRYLIESPCRADVNFPDGRSGRTVLHHAVESRDMTLLSFLLQYRFTFGLDLDAEAYCGNTALSLALGRGYHDVAEFMVLAGANPSAGLTDIDARGDDSFYLSPSETSSADVSMDSEDFEEDADYYDDFSVNGRPVDSEQPWLMF